MLGVAAVAVAGLGCQTTPGESHAEAEKALLLQLGQWHTDSLYCERGQCQDWFAFDLPSRRLVQIDVYYPAGPGLPDFEMRLKDASQATLETSQPTGRSPRRIRQTLAPGRYFIQLSSVPPGNERLSYEVVALAKPIPKSPTRPGSGSRTRSKPAPPPPPPPPRYDVVKAEVLEVEKCEGDPCMVLLDAGSPERIGRGMAGELNEGGEKLAEIRIEEVFEAGSRARIVGELGGPITLDTMAHIRVPAAQSPQ